MQARIDTFRTGNERARSIAAERANPPAEDELDTVIAPNEAFDFDVEKVEKIDRLRRRIREAEFAVDRVKKWSEILGDHTSYRNSKFISAIGTFNMCAAADCTNLGTKYCQVDEDECFAARNEQDFPMPIHFRRKQEIIWYYLDPVTWAKAFRRHVKRKDNPVTTIRFNEAGDFKTQRDIWKVNEIARRLPQYDVFTYSASSFLDWSDAKHFTVNASNDLESYGDRRYVVVDDRSEIPEDGMFCTYDATDGDIKCGDCKACITEDAPDVYVEKFEGSNK